MKINSVEFTGSVATIQKIPFRRLPEIAIAGRSNVGKSSLINCLVNRKKLALTSSTPGKTRLLNYYCVNEKYYLVDLPGYGFARVSQRERQSWRKLIESYLTDNPFLKGVVEIIDSRLGITELDKDMIEWLASIGCPTLMVATKADKLPRSKANHILHQLEREAAAWGITNMIPFSIVTRRGKEQILQSIGELLHKEVSH